MKLSSTKHQIRLEAEDNYDFFTLGQIVANGHCDTWVASVKGDDDVLISATIRVENLLKVLSEVRND